MKYARRNRPLGSPDNGAYMVAAYVIAAVIVAVYAASMFLRIRKASGGKG